MRSKILLFTFLYFILLTIFSLHIPFFWDGTTFSNIAVNFFKNGFQGFIASPEIDTGGFPLYSSYMCVLWAIFGKSLMVSHIAILPLLLGIVYQYYSLAQKYLNESAVVFAMILLMIEPVFITQSILMGYDVFLILFFLMALNYLLSHKHRLFSIAILFLCMSSIRGILLGCSLIVIDYLLNKKISHHWLTKYFPAIITLCLWTIYHHSQTGWYIFSPARENNAESFLPISKALKQAGYFIWKITDAGRIFLWTFLVVFGYMFYRKTKSQKFLELIQILFIPMIILFLFMSFLANPIGPKYFIVLFFCLQIGVCFLLFQIQSIAKRIILFISFCGILITGNFLLYPERYGNSWDSSLKVIPYFELKNKMDAYVVQNKIEPELIGTQFPLITDNQYANLTDSSFHYTNVWLGPVDNYTYYLQSNIINTDISDQVESVKKNWILLHTEQSGQVYLSLYKRK